MNAFDVAKVWLAQTMALLEGGKPDLEFFISMLKARVAAARELIKSDQRVEGEHQLRVLVPALRLAYSLRQGSPRALKGYSLSAFLLASLTNSSLKALFAPATGYVASPNWPEVSRRTAAELLASSPNLFAAVPDILRNASNGVARAQGEFEFAVLVKNKAQLRNRILAEMTLSEAERALVHRFL